MYFPGTIPHFLYTLIAAPEPRLKCVTASKTPNSKVALPTYSAFGHLPQVMPINDSFWF